MNPKGQIAIVTGAGSGLGAETAARLAAAGARVAAVDLNFEAANAVAARIGGVAFQCDVADPMAGAKVMESIDAALGQPRILVNCAGIGAAKRVVGKDGPMALEDFDRIIRVNLSGTFNMIRLVAARMTGLEPLEDGERGVIISTASVAAYEGQIGQAAYAASKGGIVALTLPIARELAQFGVRVMTLAPGLFFTPLMHTLPPDAQASLAASIPFPKRLGQAGEYAALALHCVENTFLNGEVIRLDGALRLAPK